MTKKQRGPGVRVLALLILAGGAFLVAARHNVPRPAEKFRNPPRGAFTEKKTLRIAMIGDVETDAGVMEPAVRDLRAQKADLLVFLGDLVDKNALRHYNFFVEELMEVVGDLPVASVPGNHDHDGPGGSDKGVRFREFFGPSYFFVSTPSALLLFLDTAPGDLALKQWVWMEETLRRERSRHEHLFVFLHDPPRDPRGADPSRGRSLPREAGDKVVERLVEHRATAVFAGNIHDGLEGRMSGIPLYVSGGGTDQTPRPPGWAGAHYLLLDVRPGGFEVSRRAVTPEPALAEGLEFWWAVRIAPHLHLLGFALLGLAGVSVFRSGILRGTGLAGRLS